MLVGQESINKDFFLGWNYKDFEVYVKSAKLKTGISILELAKKLGIEVPKKEKDELK